MQHLESLGPADAAALTGEQALALAAAYARQRNALDAAFAPVAARLDDLSTGPSRFARWKGFSSAAALLAGRVGIAPSDAHRLISLGRSLERTVVVVPDAVVETDAEVETGTVVENGTVVETAPGGELDLTAGVGVSEQPAVAAPAEPIRVASPLARAARAGTLGAEKIRVIEVTLAAMTIDTADVEELLVDCAKRLTIKELRIRALREFAERDPDGWANREIAQREARHLVFVSQPDGMVRVTGALDTETAGHVKALFDAEAKAIMHRQRKWAEHEQQSIGQINADILATLVKHANGCDKATTRPKTTVVVRIDEAALRAGAGIATCDGLEGPMSVETLRRMAVDAEFLPVVMGGASLPLDVGRARRPFTPAQSIALGERDKGCAMCHNPLPWCDKHHIEFWSRGGKTDLLNGVHLCVGCHHRVHDCGWIVEVDAHGDVSFIPPASVDPYRHRQQSSSERLAS